MRTRLSGWVGAAGALCLASTAWAQAGAGDGAATAPTTLTYQVQRGDTLYALAAAYLIRPSDYRIIQRLNGVQAPRRLQVGRSLTLPVNLLKTAPEQAVVTSYRGAVQIDTGQGLATPRQGQAVGEGSLVVTGANAFVRLTLSDNSHMVVPSNSRVRLSRLRRYLINDALDHGLTVERGRLESDVTRRRVPGGFRVTTPVSVSAVRGTEFRIAVDAEGERAATEVLEGEVAVNSLTDGDATDIAQANQALAITAAGLARAGLLPEPALRDPGAVLSGPRVVVDAVPQPGARAYRGRLATDAGLIDAFAETDSADGSTRLDFGPLAMASIICG